MYSTIFEQIHSGFNKKKLSQKQYIFLENLIGIALSCIHAALEKVGYSKPEQIGWNTLI